MEALCNELQKGLNEQAARLQMPFNISKCQMMHSGANDTDSDVPWWVVHQIGSHYKEIEHGVMEMPIHYV